MIKILGIETSCDETAASIVNDKREILSHVIFSQIQEHNKFGGVVPEIASRAHLSHLQKIVKKTIAEANLSLRDLDAIAVTAGPGLVGGLLVGLMFAKGLCFSLNKPLLAINHLEAHALTARLTNPEIKFPYLMLLLSGGHCQILIVESVGVYHKLGGTLDDAVGEAFDKVAKMMGLGYPGGPIIESHALNGDDQVYQFPQAMKGRKNCDFSFSGLKTAVRLALNNKYKIEDICASFQRTVSDILIDRLNNAVEIVNKQNITPKPIFSQACGFKNEDTQRRLLREHSRDSQNSFASLKMGNDIKQLVIAGGVASNQYLYKKIKDNMEAHNIITIAPPIKLCTDNGAMIAWAGIERFKLGLVEGLDIAPRPRWPLEK
ncbi:MAG: tRNA (adenosine(37)-N6)-threonylcarbamoyltransferase complex transferase subunit TsaD [Pseudomonadota bacterium]